ncbi:pyruvate ferredoxin oxidoreductase subunit gamma [Ignicoccus islandicus DSM 13165]|uniref:pyruvate synthase n=1 Tax=Ignicoccus islandicus DSM 13165 TaxID=940295 RepID=A0A0U3F2E7_9CREN|nr:pyruvate ferredoxin oxidoreductase subunit gamma [Ignicoccus islandicus]ALU11717.1 pyruvate ferredoxin oxidoreductase subunit gamma [Ignicoccus islandicus DSM 13165]
MSLVEVRWHGRGGQGAVTASEIVAIAAISEGKYAQAFPSFGVERRGAPVEAYTRISDSPIYVRSKIYTPDIMVVLDPTLLEPRLAQGLKEGGTVIVNTEKSPEEVKKILNREDAKVATVDATKIALETLKRPIVNTAILGAFVKVTGLVSLDSVLEAVKSKVPPRTVEANIEAVKRAYEEVIVP